MDESKPITAWLIERRDRGRPEWARFSDSYAEWVTDACKACWFVRREDAEQLLLDCEIDLYVTEHLFG